MTACSSCAPRSRSRPSSGRRREGATAARWPVCRRGVVRRPTGAGGAPTIGRATNAGDGGRRQHGISPPPTRGTKGAADVLGVVRGDSVCHAAGLADVRPDVARSRRSATICPPARSARAGVQAGPRGSDIPGPSRAGSPGSARTSVPPRAPALHGGHSTATRPIPSDRVPQASRPTLQTCSGCDG